MQKMCAGESGRGLAENRGKKNDGNKAVDFWIGVWLLEMEGCEVGADEL